MDGLSCSTSQKSSEIRRNATTYSQSHPSNKMENLGMEMGLRMGSGTSPCFWGFFLRGGVCRPSLNLFYFWRKCFTFLFVSFSEQMECTFACELHMLNRHVSTSTLRLLPQNGVIRRTTTSQNCHSCQFLDERAERGYYNRSDVVLHVKWLNNCFSW